MPELAALADAEDVEFFGHLTNDDRQALETFPKRTSSTDENLTGVPIN